MKKLFLLLFACAPAPKIAPDTIPTLRLPSDVRPLAESIALNIDPAQDRFSGAVDITVSLSEARKTIWLHGKNFHVTKVQARADGKNFAGVWSEQNDFASLAFKHALPPGDAVLHIEYDAAFGKRIEGLYKVSSANATYAVTQFESIAARDAFPCFDEPGFKIPFTVSLTVPAKLQAVANTREASRETLDDRMTVHFWPTKPLPSYLVAFAVGDFDVVNAPSIPPNAVRQTALPFRVLTPKGRGGEAAYALKHTPEFVNALEDYTGIAYPFDKLDLIVVPDKPGAMENAGAIMSGDVFTIFDEKKASVEQRNIFDEAMSHELAHQWVGDLVTAAWWDDIWLNEAFASWLSAKVLGVVQKSTAPNIHLHAEVDDAIRFDSLTSARAVRQKITSPGDIENAFDGITYDKGEGLLAMFEHYAGAEKFRQGLHDYLQAHAYGSATADDFLDAESKAAGEDLKTAFHTFLDQPGVPFVQAHTEGHELKLQQSRFLPLGSSGDAHASHWLTPVCARYRVKNENKESCTLLADEGHITLPEGACCVLPNAEAAGYYRFSLPPLELAQLRGDVFATLSVPERMALGNSISAAFSRGVLSLKDSLALAAPFVSDPNAEVAQMPMGGVMQAHNWLRGTPEEKNVEKFAARLYREVFYRLGWKKTAGDDDERAHLRSSVTELMLFVARDPGARAEAQKLAHAFLGDGTMLHPEAVDKDLLSEVLTVAGESFDQNEWQRVHALLAKTDDGNLRYELIGALAVGKNAQDFPLDPILRTSEVLAALWVRFEEPELREATWAWEKQNFAALMSRVPEHHGVTPLISLTANFCDQGHEDDVREFFTPERVAKIEGAPRVLANTLERIHLCVALRKVQEPGAREFFAH